MHAHGHAPTPAPMHVEVRDREQFHNHPLFFSASFLTEPGTHQFNQIDQTAQIRDPFVSFFPSTKTTGMYHNTWLSYVCARDQSKIFILHSKHTLSTEPSLQPQ